MVTIIQLLHFINKIANGDNDVEDMRDEASQLLKDAGYR